MRHAKMITVEDIYHRLGQATVLFATLDQLTTILLLNIVVDSYKSNRNRLSDKATLKPKLKKLIDLKSSDVKFPEQLAAIHAFAKKAIDVADERNNFIHDRWVFDKVSMSDGIIYRKKLLGFSSWKITMKKKPYTLNQIGNLNFRIDQLQQELIPILKSIGH